MSEKIKVIIAEVLKINKEDIKEDMLIDDIPQWDSLMFLIILSRLSEDLGIEIPVDKALEITKISEILAYGENKNV